MVVNKGKSCILYGILTNYLESMQCIICFLVAKQNAVYVLTIYMEMRAKGLAKIGKKLFL